MCKPTTMIVWCFLVISPVLFTCGSNSEENKEMEDLLVVNVEEEHDHVDDESGGVFQATEKWKVIKKGQHIPPGLHVRMNLQTGKKEAKLLDKEDSEGTPQELSKGQRPYGESDRMGVVNKRTKVFSVEEVADMMKDINDDHSVDLDNLPRIASSLLAPEDKQTEVNQDNSRKNNEGKKHLNKNAMKNLPVSLHPDVEVMLELSTVLANKSSSVYELSEALEELEYYVHRMDNAKDLNVIGGLVLVVRLLNHTHPDVRSWAAHVIGSATQSNPSVQEMTLQYGTLPLLCKLLSLSQPELVQRRALFAISSLLRSNPKEQVNFMKTYRGIDMLGESFNERSPQVQLKAAVLLTDFLNSELSNSDALSGHHLEFPLLLYNGVLNSGWCENVPTLIHSDQLEKIEKGLLAMKALGEICGFSTESARLKELVKQFERSRNEPTVDIEYTDNMLQHCKTILKHIRTQNLDL